MLIAPPVTFTFLSQFLNPLLVIATVCSPAANSIAEGVLPTKLPSISISAPPGFDATDSLVLAGLSLSAAGISVGPALTGAVAGAPVGSAARIAVPRIGQSFPIASHAS